MEIQICKYKNGASSAFSFTFDDGCYYDSSREAMEIFENIYQKTGIKIKATVGIKDTIKDYGVDEDDFLARLDDMVEQAFDDQCTGANPRYPLMSEIKQMYLNAYYGKHFTEKEMPKED